MAIFMFSNNTYGPSTCPMPYGVCLPRLWLSKLGAKAIFHIAPLPPAQLDCCLHSQSDAVWFCSRRGNPALMITVIGPVPAVWVFVIGDESCLGREQR